MQETRRQSLKVVKTMNYNALKIPHLGYNYILKKVAMPRKLDSYKKILLDNSHKLCLKSSIFISPKKVKFIILHQHYGS